MRGKRVTAYGGIPNEFNKAESTGFGVFNIGGNKFGTHRKT